MDVVYCYRLINKIIRGVAQFGRALGSGPRGRVFKSHHSDHLNTRQYAGFADCLVFYIAFSRKNQH